MAGLVPAIHGHCLNVAVSRSGGFFRTLQEDGPSAACTRDNLRRCAGGQQPPDRLAAIDNKNFFSRLDGPDQLRQPVLGFKNVDLHLLTSCLHDLPDAGVTDVERNRSG